MVNIFIVRYWWVLTDINCYFHEQMGTLWYLLVKLLIVWSMGTLSVQMETFWYNKVLYRLNWYCMVYTDPF